MTELTPEKARMELGLSLADIARKMRQNPRTIRGYELHGCNTLYKAQRLAGAYRCSPYVFLFTGSKRAEGTKRGRTKSKTRSGCGSSRTVKGE